MPAAARRSHGPGGRCVDPGAPTSIPLAALLAHPPSSSAYVRTQRPPHGPPERGGDAGSYLRKGRGAVPLEAARVRAGDTEASATAAAGA